MVFPIVDSILRCMVTFVSKETVVGVVPDCVSVFKWLIKSRNVASSEEILFAKIFLFTTTLQLLLLLLLLLTTSSCDLVESSMNANVQC